MGDVNIWRSVDADGRQSFSGIALYRFMHILPISQLEPNRLETIIE